LLRNRWASIPLALFLALSALVVGLNWHSYKLSGRLLLREEGEPGQEEPGDEPSALSPAQDALDRQRRLRGLHHLQIAANLLLLASGGLCLYGYGQSTRAAETASRRKTLFLARASHEIRTPLNAIIGFCELAQRNYGPKSVEYIHNAQNAGNALLTIINDILDYSRIEAGHMAFERRPYDLASVIDDALTIARLRINEKSVQLVVDADPGMPGELVGDAGRVRMVLLNMLGNAAKYTHVGTVTLSLRHERLPRREAARLEITVADTGVGITQEDQLRLFTDYGRGDKDRLQGIEGTGLGLSTTRQLCRAMGGDIAMVSSVAGQGTVFRATLVQDVADWRPLGDIGSRPAVRAPRQDYVVSFGAPDANVLVVDDLASNLLVAEGLLAAYGVRVVTCMNGREALDQLRTEHPFDLVLLDHMMPGLDGIQTLRAMRALGGQARMVPVVAVTANAMAGMREKFLDMGFDDFLSKPLEMSKLDILMRRWIKKEKQRTSRIEQTERKRLKTAAQLNIDVSKIGGMDLAGVLAAAGHSAPRFRALVQMASRDIEGYLPNIRVVPNDSALLGLVLPMHSLKGILGNIGMPALSDRAAQLEVMASHGRATAFNELVVPFREELVGLVGRLCALDHSLGDGEARPQGVAPVPPSGGLKPLREALTSRDIRRMDEALEQLEIMPSGPGQTGMVAQIAEHILMGEYTKAIHTIDRLTDKGPAGGTAEKEPGSGRMPRAP